MRKLLDEKLARFEELERLLSDPATQMDSGKMAAIAREHGSLARLATKYRRFRSVIGQIGEVRQMAASSDPDERALAESELETLTAPDGTFELDLPHATGHIDVVSPGWTSIFRPEFKGAPASLAGEAVIVVARSVTLAGVVVDADGRPIESATLAVPLPFGLRARFDSILDDSSTVERGTRTDSRYIASMASNMPAAYPNTALNSAWIRMTA